MLNKSQKYILTFLRVSMGWLFFYAGITKVLNPEWTSAGYLKSAQTFSSMYEFFASPNVINVIDLLNQWGLTLIGLSLIFGVCVKISSILGSFLMILYYFPILDFPYAGDHSFIVDDHIIYALTLILIVYFDAGKYYSFQKIFQRKK